MTIHSFTGFTGIDQVYEAPLAPDLSLITVDRSINDTMMEVITLLEENVSSKAVMYHFAPLCSNQSF
jgi:adenylylsulfate kinase-like enzyme